MPENGILAGGNYYDKNTSRSRFHRP